MLSATLSARYCHSSQRVVLRLAAPASEGGNLAILTVHRRDPLAGVKALEFSEQAEALLSDGALDVLHYSPDYLPTLAESLGVY